MIARVYKQMFQVGLPYYLELNPGRQFQKNVQKTRKQIFKNIDSLPSASMFPKRFSFSIRETSFSGSILFPRCKLCCCYTAENFNENPSM